MKAPDFDYLRPASLAAAVAMLAEHDGEAMPLAGGQSLLPMMNFRVATPEALIDLADLSELRGIWAESDTIRIGAMTRYAELKANSAVQKHIPLFNLALPHIAHDAIIGDRVIIVNSAAIAGHCILEDDVIVGGLSGIHQFVRIGRGAIIGAVTMVTNDVIPYGLVQAPRGQLDGLNLVGLKRRGVERGDIMALRAAFQMMAQGEGTFQDRVKRMGEDSDSDYVHHIVDFVTGASDRSFLTPGG